MNEILCASDRLSCKRTKKRDGEGRKMAGWVDMGVKMFEHALQTARSSWVIWHVPCGFTLGSVLTPRLSEARFMEKGRSRSINCGWSASGRVLSPMVFGHHSLCIRDSPWFTWLCWIPTDLCRHDCWLYVKQGLLGYLSTDLPGLSLFLMTGLSDMFILLLTVDFYLCFMSSTPRQKRCAFYKGPTVMMQKARSFVMSITYLLLSLLPFTNRLLLCYVSTKASKVIEREKIISDKTDDRRPITTNHWLLVLLSRHTSKTKKH